MSFETLAGAQPESHYSKELLAFIIIFSYVQFICAVISRIRFTKQIKWGADISTGLGSYMSRRVHASRNRPILDPRAQHRSRVQPSCMRSQSHDSYRYMDGWDRRSNSFASPQARLIAPFPAKRHRHRAPALITANATAAATTPLLCAREIMCGRAAW